MHWFVLNISLLIFRNNIYADCTDVFCIFFILSNPEALRKNVFYLLYLKDISLSLN